MSGDFYDRRIAKKSVIAIQRVSMARVSVQKHFEKHTHNFRMEIYEGTEHGFAFPDRHSYHKKAAEMHWSRIHDLFQKSLK